MGYSTELKRAVAAAAVTRLNAGRRNLEASATWVSSRLGNAVFPDRKEKVRVRMLLEYRKKILSVSNDKPSPTRLSIARYHYDRCLDWVKDAGLKPEESARILVRTLLNEVKS